MRDPNALPMSETRTIARLKRRADFVRAAKGKRWHGQAFSLQALSLQSIEQAIETDREAARVGLTLTRKVGNAVIRNRARRRLREALRLTHDLPLRAAYDYVIIGRVDAIRLPFDMLKTELARAIGAVHDEARGGSRRADGDRPNRTRLKP